MCGICGIFYFDRRRPAERDTLAAMNQQIAHRGPDDEGFYLEGNVGLAMRRLSIIDVQSGHQPISNEQENVWIVYNGEIYNHQQLRRDLEDRGHRYRTHTDTETIVHLYEEYGADCVQHLRGMFAFVIWDRRSRKLFAARDRLGIKPFYYRYDSEKFLFGSEIKTVLAYPGVEAQFNQSILPEYLAFGYVVGEDTFFREIQKLPPGHTLELNEGGQLRVEQYWDLDISLPEPPRPRSYYVQTYRELLEEAVSSHLMSDVPLGVFLSGGLDSSAVAALAQRSVQEPLQTFSVGYAEQSYSELPFARTVANYLGSEHHEVTLTREQFFQALPKLIWHEDEPIVWPSSVSLYFVAQLARQHVTVVLTGEGSDETLAGYTRYAWTLWNSRIDSWYRRLTPGSLRARMRRSIRFASLNSSVRRRLEHTFLGRDGASWESFYFDNFYSAFSSDEQVQLRKLSYGQDSRGPYSASMRFFEKSSQSLLKRLLYADCKTYLVELLMKQDNMSMAASIESRVPFLDHKLVEFAFRIPPQYSTRRLAGKRVLKDIAEDLLPHSIVHRRKMGFPTPWAGWLVGRQLEEIEQMLIGGRSLERGWFEQEALQRLFHEHRSGSRDNTTRIWRLLNLELWSRIFLDRDPDLLPPTSASSLVASHKPASLTP
ncbi:MAG: asparagine synthase (glutamine-hydrolyzing) [Acidobacteria bacterium]|nr:asparagine synthase (glutamine-hydrolyzing) [Acidobacteriota bacterium]